MSATHGQEHVRYVIARLYAPDLKRASAIQRLLHDVNRAKYRVRTAEESAQDDSASSDSTASSPTTPGVLTPPASLPQTPQPPVKDDASNSRGIITYRASRPVTGRVFPVRRLGETPAEFAYHDGQLTYYTRVIMDDSPHARRIGFKMMLDTASNTTWIRRRDYRALNKRNKCITFPHDWRGRNHSVLYGVPEEQSISSLEKRAHRIEYGDGSTALVWQYPISQPITAMTMLECESYNDVQGTRWQDYLKFHYQYALALAVNSTLDRAHEDGMFGLGARRYQEFNDPAVVVNSFFNELVNNIPPPLAPEPIDPVMYFGLRPIPLGTPVEEEHLYESFWTMNGWACPNKPEFSPKIRVLPASSATLGVPEEYRYWDVDLVRMQIRTRREDGRWDVMEIPLRGEDTQAEQGESTASGSSSKDGPWQASLRVTLDTGSSLSYLPKQAIEAIALYFNAGSSTHLVANDEEDNDPIETYQIPDGEFSSDHDKREVALHFRAAESRDTVAIHVPALQFLYAPHPDEEDGCQSLIYTPESSDNVYILGVNFFHVAWIAMYKPPTGAPYIRMARQGSSLEEVLMYQLPKLDAVAGQAT